MSTRWGRGLGAKMAPVSEEREGGGTVLGVGTGGNPGGRLEGLRALRRLK